MTGFKNFVMRGNLVELAVAVVIGTQFSSLVKQFVSSFIDPLLSLVGGTPDLGKLVLHAGKATFTYGRFLTEALTFLRSRRPPNSPASSSRTAAHSGRSEQLRDGCLC